MTHQALRSKNYIPWLLIVPTIIAFCSLTTLQIPFVLAVLVLWIAVFDTRPRSILEIIVLLGMSA